MFVGFYHSWSWGFQQLTPSSPHLREGCVTRCHHFMQTCDQDSFLILLTNVTFSVKPFWPRFVQNLFPEQLPAYFFRFGEIWDENKHWKSLFGLVKVKPVDSNGSKEKQQIFTLVEHQMFLFSNARASRQINGVTDALIEP